MSLFRRAIATAFPTKGAIMRAFIRMYTDKGIRTKLERLNQILFREVRQGSPLDEQEKEVFIAMIDFLEKESQRQAMERKKK